MIDKIFATVLSVFYKKPKPQDGPNFALSCTFECYDCGRQVGANNWSTCSGCGKCHFKVVAVHFGGTSVYINPPKPNCTMAYGSVIALPDAFSNPAVKKALWETGKAFVRGDNYLGNPVKKED